MKWIRESWYVIALESEIPSIDHEKVFSRTILGERILVYRSANNLFQLIALRDRCVHRKVPISTGIRIGDNVRCGYHGLQYCPTGKLCKVPGMEDSEIQNRAIKSYPAEIRHGYVFVWMGKPHSPDYTLLPSDDELKPIGTHAIGYMHAEVSANLLCDNLLDFTHLDFVHPTTLGGTTTFSSIRPEIKEIDRGVSISWDMPDVEAPPYYGKFRRFASKMDRWFHYTFKLPGVLMMDSGGKPKDPSDVPVKLQVKQFIVPETETTSHYFFSQSLSKEFDEENIGDVILKESLVKMMNQTAVEAFTEDIEILKLQPSKSHVNINFWFDEAAELYNSLYQGYVQAESSVV